MAITAAKGTLFQLGDTATPASYATITQMRSVSGPSIKATIQDITTHSTVGNWREKLACLLDAGQISFPSNFDKADATHAFTTGLWSLFVNLTLRGYKLIFPNSAGTLTFHAYVMDHAFTAPVDNVLQVQFGFDITGAIVAS